MMSDRAGKSDVSKGKSAGETSAFAVEGGNANTTELSQRETPAVRTDDVQIATAPKNDSVAPKKNAALVGDVASGDSDNEAAMPPLATPPNQEEEDDAHLSLFSCKVFLIALPNILVPLLYGYEIGLVGPYSTMYKWATNCELFTEPTPCETLAGAKCKWGSVTNLNGTNVTQCSWRDRDTCSLLYSTEGACSANSVCTWDYSGKTCGNKVGYTSIYSGLFAGSMTIGAMVGSLAAGVMTEKLNYRMSYLIICIMTLVASILTHVATGIFQYWLLFVARIILGFPMGWQAVIGPSYVSTFSPKKFQKTLGTFFQVFCAFGEFVAAFFAIVIGQTIKYHNDTNAMLQGRMQGFVCVTTFLTLLSFGLYFICKDVPNKQSELDENGREDGMGNGQRSQNKQYSCCKMVGPILLGLCMSATLQLTGINAVMNFAPTIMSNLGLAPLVGNIVVMAWNSATAFGVIPLSRYFSMRTLFLSCAFFGSAACLFLCGIPVYPGITHNEKAKEGVAILGIALFIAAYEFGIGPCFFVLAGDVFPASFRPIGQSLTVGFQFTFNVVINICYPIATEGMSGGPGGNQDKGQAIAFIFFGCIGLVTATIEFFFLKNAEGDDDNSIQDNQHMVADNYDKE